MGRCHCSESLLCAGTFQRYGERYYQRLLRQRLRQGKRTDGSWQLDEPQAPDHGYRTGRIKLGTESSGGFRNIVLTNCIFEHCRGLALETVDGGHLEDIVISNITMRDIVNAPIFLRLGARMRSPEGHP